MYRFKSFRFISTVALATTIIGCSSNSTLPQATTRASLTTDVNQYQYLIGPGDTLTIFVWRNPEVSGQFVVRPDGKVTTSLVEDIDVAGKTPSMLAREIEEQLSTYINSPRVTVSVNSFSGPLSEQVRVIGEATNPSAVNYTEHMTLLDLMIAVGGLTEFAHGNGAKLVRVVNGQQKTYTLDIDDLIRSGDISKNVDILPGDIVIIPEAWF
ncbi:polysaccharide biosynthesis/export protein [Alteromonas macleodii str. 'Black Sea 11']|jgi:polysaccharide export outer membrane protein|uniref:XrtA/PEP-CTERM system exopolysaccharide export protein n=1 Tax=Alteromonas abrolhosensis TaxID=1892904 RepID=UPI000286E4FF|nr:XrtA/PEP-CTERM system exopolysaccharide export protein [Alteromonas abrolhosensis]AFT79209.1 polysaccharide biosynthesis/export protein [Alteromonas macleodii str. 'Black Sea 11']NKW90673.1 sugar ABC transporter substrate-binding protein [Alteromonadaceae bacterium A_SAG4]NKX04565.1 sugar ABC transporter substrate-binding protein [Alteromonadaceae bacterium A_SAG6]NKX33802.1 sugar ABC transporter substrate-binding protein [Alteromonadaceae bacterium A_SAG3]NKX68994.1 sugar ABC transporter s|tara:strand:+ start:28835 stop:29467 length:633 start_codon:yes stop_codon:yes gene_type:complete